MAAVKTNQVEVVEYLLGKKVSTAPVPFSITALHLAAERNYFECIRLLLRHNALVDPLKGNEVYILRHTHKYGWLCRPIFSPFGYGRVQELFRMTNI